MWRSVCKVLTDKILGGGYEILCLDDCSNDGTFELLTRLAKRYSAVKVFRNERNSGVSFTRNRLISQAEGEYVWFVDPDDMLYPNVVNLALQAADDVRADVLLGNYTRVRENDKTLFEPLKSVTAYGNERLSAKPVDGGGVRMNAVWAGLFRRDFLLSNNLFFNEKMIAQEDTLFYYEFGLRTRKIFKFDELSYIYRQRESSVMHTHDSMRALRYYYSMQEMYRVYQHHYDTGDYDDKSVLLHKLAHMKQNLALTLAGLRDTKLVRTELKILKKSGLYPYRQKVLPPSGFQRILAYMLPCECGFWMIHLLYKARYLINRN